MFAFVKNDNGDNFPVVELKPAAAATYEVGDTLKLNASTGAVEKTYGTNKPQYVCACQVVAASGDTIAVSPVYAGQTFQTEFSVDGSALKAGAKVTIASDSRKVTATTTNGVATLITDGGVTGASVLVKFE